MRTEENGKPMEHQDEKLNLFERFRGWLESVFLTRLVPTDNPGPVFRYIFKIPILFIDSA
jgi:hypothetical protein